MTEGREDIEKSSSAEYERAIAKSQVAASASNSKLKTKNCPIPP
jgi:hypothetical protein